MWFYAHVKHAGFDWVSFILKTNDKIIIESLAVHLNKEKECPSKKGFVHIESSRALIPTYKVSIGQQ